MKTYRMHVLAVSLLLVLLTAAAGSDSPEQQKQDKDPLERFSAEQQKKLKAGDAVFEHVQKKGPDGNIHGHAQSSAIINAPVDKSFDMFCEFDKHHRYFPRKTASEVIKSGEGWALVHKVFDFYLVEVEYVVRYDIDPEKHRVDFKMDKDYKHDIKDTAGFFDFDKIDKDRCLFTYAATKVDTGLMVPGFIQKYITSRDLPAVVLNIKKRIESGGEWTKKD